MARPLRKLSPQEILQQVECIALEFMRSKELEGSLLHVEPDALLLHEREGHNTVHWIATFTSTSLRVNLRTEDATFTEMALNHGDTWSAFYGDELELITALPWPAVNLSGIGVLGTISTMVQAGTGYRKFLKLYPDVRCEPLEPFYICRRVTGALTFPIVKDLLLNHGWRGANYGALLVLLAPKPEYLPLLVDASSRWKYADRAIELAMVACGGFSPLAPDLQKFHAHCTSVREMLDELPFVPLPLRPPLTEFMYRELRKELEAVRVLYRTEGVEAARTAMKTGLIGYIDLRHLEWVQLGCPAPPVVDPEKPVSPKSEIHAPPPGRWKWPWRFW